MPNETKNQSTDSASPSNPSARHNARAYAIQAMYQWQMAGTPVAEIEAEFLRYHIEKKLDMDLFKELLHGIPANQHDIDDAMRPYIGRHLSEMDPIELAVLRVAVYELLKRPDIPYRVIINEALELTKKFGSVEGHKFVNGALDKIARKIRAIEIGMGSAG